MHEQCRTAAAPTTCAGTYSAPRSCVTPDSGLGMAAAASAATAHLAVPTSVTRRRLPLLGDTEHLRWLYRPRGETHDGHRPGTTRPEEGPAR